MKCNKSKKNYNNFARIFSKRPDAIFNLLDALSGDGHQYKSVVELSQSPRFEREYSSITDAITHGLSDADFKKIQTQVFNHTRATVNRPHLFFTDCTNNPRPYAKVMREREIVHFPNPAPGNKPICVGHQYSLVAMAPLGERSKSGHWLIPLSMQRVGLDEKGHEAGVQQVSVSIQVIFYMGLKHVAKKLSLRKIWCRCFGCLISASSIERRSI